MRQQLNNPKNSSGKYHSKSTVCQNVGLSSVHTVPKPNNVCQPEQPYDNNNNTVAKIYS